MDVPCTPITPATCLQKELSYEMTFTCISSGNSTHRSIFSYEKRKDDKQEFYEMSFEKLTSYIKHKTFHMKSTNFHMKIDNLKHRNIFSYKKG